MLLQTLLSLLLVASSRADQVAKPNIWDGNKWVDLPIADPASNKPQYPIVNPTVAKDKSATIYVALTSFRDFRCSDTLTSIFKNAKYPERVFVGLLHQMLPESTDESCLKTYCAVMRSYTTSKCPHKENIRAVDSSSLDSRGPSTSRYMQHTMLRNEEFYLQLDSHSLLTKDWDVLMLEEWVATGNEYAVLSTYPPDVADKAKFESGGESVGTVPHLCASTFAHKGMVRNARAVPVSGLNSDGLSPQPILTTRWAPQFSFSRSHLERKVPADPHLVNVYDGYDFSKYARMWTRGYDVYTPSRVLLFHDYGRILGSKNAKQADAAAKPKQKYDPSNWQNNGQSPVEKRQAYENGVYRVRMLLNMPGAPTDAKSLATLSIFGLGTRRTLDAFIDYTGVDVRRLTNGPSRCFGRGAAVRLVPFSGGGDADVDLGDAWGMDAEKIPAAGQGVPLESGPVEWVSLDALWATNVAYTASRGSSLAPPSPVADMTGNSGETDETGAGADVLVNDVFLRLPFPLCLVDPVLAWLYAKVEPIASDQVSKHQIVGVLLVVVPIALVCLASTIVSVWTSSNLKQASSSSSSSSSSQGMCSEDSDIRHDNDRNDNNDNNGGNGRATTSTGLPHLSGSPRDRRYVLSPYKNSPAVTESLQEILSPTSPRQPWTGRDPSGADYDSGGDSDGFEGGPVERGVGEGVANGSDYYDNATSTSVSRRDVCSSANSETYPSRRGGASPSPAFRRGMV
jgi:hypothetical protein